MNLKNTIGMMCSDDYKQRFKAEYYQLKIRYGALKSMVDKWDNGELDFEPTCDRKIYDDQLDAMSLYLGVLEKRAIKEGVDLNEKNKNIKTNDLVFAKVRENAIIPTKEEENAGRDVYACFDENYMIIPPNTTVLIPTGIASALSPKYEIRLRDRGSNGSKGIHVNAGTIDSGYRGEWFVAWCNTNCIPVVLSKFSQEETMETLKLHELLYKDMDVDTIASKCIYYPYTKAIAQAEVCEVPIMNQYEVSYDELKAIPSKRGEGKLGSSNK